MNSAYSKALALESLDSHFMREKYEEKTRTYHFVTAQDLERFARIVAYKVAHNLQNGHAMDPGGDPLTYIH